MLNDKLLNSLLETALREDLGDGDHSSLACIPESAKGTARLLVKEQGIIAGIRVARLIFQKIDSALRLELFFNDGDAVKVGDVVFLVHGSTLSILKAERMVLNVMQRMSGVATLTSEYVKRLEGLSTKVLDTRKTTPGMRVLDKEAVRLGGGTNHRMGLFDAIMLKDNHIDFAGGIEMAINKTISYLRQHGEDLQIIIEARSLEDVREILRVGKINRILLDNLTVAQTREAIELIGGRFKTESSGNITLDNLRDYAECGVDYISVGALTHQIRSLDLSLKAVR